MSIGKSKFQINKQFNKYNNVASSNMCRIIKKCQATIFLGALFQVQNFEFCKGLNNIYNIDNQL